MSHPKSLAWKAGAVFKLLLLWGLNSFPEVALQDTRKSPPSSSLGLLDVAFRDLPPAWKEDEPGGEGMRNGMRGHDPTKLQFGTFGCGF